MGSVAVTGAPAGCDVSLPPKLRTTVTVLPETAVMETFSALAPVSMVRMELEYRGLPVRFP